MPWQEEDQVLFEFVVLLKGDPLGIQRLSDKFADFIASNEPAVTAELHLQEAGCDCYRWPMDVLFDGFGKMYLHTGWLKFAHYHDLEADCVLTFSYLGDADMSVKVFDDTRCRWHYRGDSDEEDN
ncbi:B3 domain-containing protein Os03g0212300-like [Lolium perenne]|uniref:B3 domain-containing protein Os03g0212300-like n=1 Tax=Lolium perenne TaxID=4522 RepID=UPI0021F5141A|nr:B3 domain-containing protein Os03g0212300-like [Lolium perenne]